MVRFIASALVLGLIFFIIGRCQLNNAAVGMGQSIYDTIAVIVDIKSSIARYYHRHQKLPNSNHDLKAPPPEQYARKSKLLRDIEVLENGIIYVRFQAENKGSPVELVYIPKPTSKYSFKWHCESFNLTKHWRSVIPEVCSETKAPFNKDLHVKPDTESYIKQVTEQQRQANKTQQPTENRLNCDAMAKANNGFVHIGKESVALVIPNRWENTLSIAKPQSLHSTAHLGLENYLVYFADNRLYWLKPEEPKPLQSSVFLNQPNRFIRDGEFFWANSGPGLIKISLCDQSEPNIKAQYPMNLGVYSVVNDFRILDNFAFLTTSQKTNRHLNSALQIVQLLPNKTIGFLKLEGKAKGLTVKDRYAFIANDRFGIAVVDIFDVTLPRLLQRTTTKDAALDILPMDNFFIVADRLAGVSVYVTDNTNLLHVKTIPTHSAAIQLSKINSQAIAVSLKNGETKLLEWNNGNLTPVDLN